MQGRAWWKQPVRLMRYGWSTDLARTKDADLHALAHLIRDRFHCNVDGAQAMPSIPPIGDLDGGMGTVTFDAPGYRRCPGLEDWDFLRAWIPIAHEHGLKVVPYLNLHWFNYSFGCAHPEWVQRLADGRAYGDVYPLYGNGTTMCVNSPWRDWTFGLLEALTHTGADGAFLDGPVVYPNACYCDSCRALFAERNGHDLPPEMDWDSPIWKEFVAFREDSLAVYVRDARAVFRRGNPDGMVFCNAGTFRPGAWRVARDIERLETSQDINVAEAFFHPGRSDIPLHFSALTGKYERSGNLPGLVGIHHMYGPYHFLSLNPEEMELGLAQAMAVGTGVYFVVNHDAVQTMPEETLAPTGPLALQERHEELWSGAASGAEIAVLASSATLHFYVSRLQEIYREGGSAREEALVADLAEREHVDWAARKHTSDRIVTLGYDGWFALLTRNHFQFDVLLDNKITPENLSRYRLLILPNAACLSRAQLQAIEAFLESGGALIASFESGAYGERGSLWPEWTLGQMCGAKRLTGAFPVSKTEEFTALRADSVLAAGLGTGGRLPRAYYAAQIESEIPAEAVYHQATGGVYRPLRKPSDSPSIIVQGAPRTIYFAEALGHAYSVLKTPWHETLMRNAVLFCLDNEPILTTDAPKTLQVELWRQPNRLLLHLVNNTGDMQRPISERLPLRDLTVSVRCENKPKRVWAAASESDIAHTWQGGKLDIQIVELDLYDVIAIEC